MEALASAESIIPEIRLALDRSLEDDALVAAGADLCVTALRHWFEVRDPEEGLERAEAFLDRCDAMESSLVARLHVVVALLCQTLGDYARMENHARLAEALLGDSEVIDRVRVFSFLAMVAEYRGEYDEAEEMYRRTRELSSRIGYRRGEASALANHGAFLAATRLNFSEAARCCLEASAIFRELGDDIDAATAQGNAAENLAALGELDRAAILAAEALAESRRLGHTTVLSSDGCASTR